MNAVESKADHGKSRRGYKRPLRFYPRKEREVDARSRWPSQPPDGPPEFIRLAEILARWAARREWGDLDDLHSAALLAVHRAIDHPAFPTVERPRAFVATFAIKAMGHLRQAKERREAKAWGRCVRLDAERPDGTRAANDVPSREPDPAAGAMASEFWDVACDELPQTQRAALRLVFGEDLGPTLAAPLLAVNARSVGDRVNRAMHVVVRNLAPFRPHFRRVAR